MVYLGPELGCPTPDGVHTVFAYLEALGQAVPGRAGDDHPSATC